MMIAILLALLLQTPSDAARAFDEGNAAFTKGENDKALAAYDRAIALDPKNADYHLARCKTLPRLQRHEEAIASCTTALTLRPDDPAALIERGHYYINLHKVDLALADLTRVEAMKHDDYALWYHLSLGRYLSGDFAKAADTYPNCVRTAKTPDNQTACKAWQYLALRRAGRGADAAAILDAFTPDPKQEPNAYVDRLLLFTGAKTEADAAKLMEKDALQLPTVAYSIGMWHLLNGRDDKAREYFEKASAPPAQQSAFGAVASDMELKRIKK
jgi:tetratricopeptide (TPR) repeat protein